MKLKFSGKQFLTLFIVLLIPNIFRQVIYYISYLKTNSTDFIASFETKVIFESFPFLGIIEEIIIGLVFVFIWFYFKKLRFFSYGWIHDALFDYISVVIWLIFGFTPLQFLGMGIVARFLVREILIPYVILGPLTQRFNIKKLSLIYGAIGASLALILQLSL